MLIHYLLILEMPEANLICGGLCGGGAKWNRPEQFAIIPRTRDEFRLAKGPAWRPGHFARESPGTRLRFDFSICKLLDFAVRPDLVQKTIQHVQPFMPLYREQHLQEISKKVQ